MALALTCSAIFLLACWYWYSHSTPDPLLIRDSLHSALDAVIADLPPSHSAAVKLESPARPASALSPSLQVCSLLAGKRLLFVGPDTTYHLHLLWLNSLQAHQSHSLRCLGRDFCTFHHICQSPAASADYTEELIGRKKIMPGRNALLATRSAVLQYSLSTDLYASKNKSDPAYNRPQMNPWNEVRISNTFWIRRAQKADIVVLHRGPIEAPAWTYSADVSGNWSFTELLCQNQNYLAPLHCASSFEYLLVNAALHATFHSFLPPLLRTLRTVSQVPRVQPPLLIWHASWFIHPLCATAGLPKNMVLVRDVWSNFGEQVFVDPWTLFYNAQVYIHDHLLQHILPRYDISYLPMAFPDHPGFPDPPFAGDEQFTLDHAKDCILNPWPTFGKDFLEETFFSALLALLSNNAP